MEIGAVLAWGAVSSSGLVAGAVAGTFFTLSHRAIALAMSLSAGLLLAAASIELAAEAIRATGAPPAVALLLVGAAIMSAANVLLARRGAAHRKRCGECTPQPSESEHPGSGAAIAAGTALDAIPEALVLGLALRGDALPVELVVAIALGNLPEALSGSAGMRLAGRSHRYILLLWASIAVGAVLTTVAAYATLTSTMWIPYMQALGAGALLAMTAETMIPEAFHNSPRFSGFVAALGFCVLLLVES